MSAVGRQPAADAVAPGPGRMSVLGVLAIIAVYLLGTAGWFTLGAASTLRSGDFEVALQQSVTELWGGELTQQAPRLSARLPGSMRHQLLTPARADVHAVLRLEHRRKGLLWFPTYAVEFDARYTVRNETRVAQVIDFHLPLPRPDATYDRVVLRIDGQAVSVRADRTRGLRHRIELAPGGARLVEVGYRTRGLGVWRYQPASAAGAVGYLEVTVETDFEAVDFPPGSLSPTAIEAQADGVRLRWTAERALTSANIGVVMPRRLNPGPVAARMSFFAPVGLVFFFVVLAAIGIVRGIRVHPMHYLFVTAGFFAFHLLFAYLVDVVEVYTAFAVASGVSLLLVGSYLRAALGARFPWLVGIGGQLFYLVLFSYSFFLDGLTGLTITIGAVATLALMMALTAGLDWRAVFAPSSPSAAPAASRTTPTPTPSAGS